MTDSGQGHHQPIHGKHDAHSLYRCSLSPWLCMLALHQTHSPRSPCTARVLRLECTLGIAITEAQLLEHNHSVIGGTITPVSMESSISTHQRFTLPHSEIHFAALVAVYSGHFELPMLGVATQCQHAQVRRYTRRARTAGLLRASRATARALHCSQRSSTQRARAASGTNMFCASVHLMFGASEALCPTSSHCSTVDTETLIVAYCTFASP